MSDFDKRSLIKDVSELNKKEMNFLTKFTCAVNQCGADFEFRITKDAYEQHNEKLRKYAGACGKCGKRILLNETQFKTWNKLISGSELKIIETTYSSLFDDSEANG